MRVRDIKHPKSSEEDLKKVYFNSGNLTPQGTKVIIGSRREGTPGILVTGHIIGDRPSVNWGIFPRHSSSKRGLKANSNRMDIRFQKRIRILLDWGRTKGFDQRVHEIYYLLPSERR